MTDIEKYRHQIKKDRYESRDLREDKESFYKRGYLLHPYAFLGSDCRTYGLTACFLKSRTLNVLTVVCPLFPEEPGNPVFLFFFAFY